MYTFKDGEKGAVLVSTIILIFVLVILTGVFFFSSANEKISSDKEKHSLQALYLSEAGCQHGIEELRLRVGSYINLNVGQSSVAPDDLEPYVTSDDSLGFLRDYACIGGGTQFNITGSGSSRKAVLNLTANAISEMLSNINGNYNASIVVMRDGTPTSPAQSTYLFPYKYEVVTAGDSSSVQKQTTLTSGTFDVTVQLANFARYALFTEHHKMQGGTTVWFTANTNFTGPVHTNEQFSFANNPSGTFSDLVTQRLSSVRFYNLGNPVVRIGTDRNLNRDVPVFQNGFLAGAPNIDLPSSLDEQDMKEQALGTLATDPSSNGVYLPNDGSNNLTGGIFVQGNSTIALSVVNNNPMYNINPTGTGNRRYVEVDYDANGGVGATYVYTNYPGTPVHTYVGIPSGSDGEGTIIYTKGSITSFQGTVQEDTRITVAARDDVYISGDVMYEGLDRYEPGDPVPTATGANNVLGLIAWNGDVTINKDSCPNNVNIHGVIMAPSDTPTIKGEFKVSNYDSGSPKGTATLLGGAIVDYYGAFGTFNEHGPVSGYGRNFVYDARMLSGMKPPYFPLISKFEAQPEWSTEPLIYKQD